MTGRITPSLFRMALTSFEIPLSLWRILIILDLGCQAVLKTCPLPFCDLFPGQRQACGPGERALRGKSIGLSISDFELWISDLLGLLFFNPHSAMLCSGKFF
jgi:hypothetical protein